MVEVAAVYITPFKGYYPPISTVEAQTPVHKQQDRSALSGDDEPS